MAVVAAELADVGEADAQPTEMVAVVLRVNPAGRNDCERTAKERRDSVPVAHEIANLFR